MKKKTRNDSKYTVDSVIVCDDIRTEISGKDILIGVYNRVAVFNSFPTSFNKLYFRIALLMPSVGDYNFTIILEEEATGEPVMSVGNTAVVSDIETAAIIGVILVGFPVEKPTTLLIKLGLSGDTETIGKFSVRLPINDEERRRVPV